MGNKSKILVIGASGVLGRLICRELQYLLGEGIDLYIGDYKEVRGSETAQNLNGKYCFVGKEDESSIEKAIQGIDLVVVTINQSKPVIQRLCLQKGIKSIDVTVKYGLILAVQKLHEQFFGEGAGTVMMSGFFPGLSGLMVKDAIQKFEDVEGVDVSLIQNTNANVGVTGIADMLELIAEPVEDTTGENSRTLSGFKKKRKIDIPERGILQNVRLIHHSEKKVLQNMMNTEKIRYWTCWNNKFFTQMIASILRLRLIGILTSDKGKKILGKSMKHKKANGEETYLIVETKGKNKNRKYNHIGILKTFSDYETTAKVTSALISIMLEKEIIGMKFPFEITCLDEVIRIMNEPRIEIFTYVHGKKEKSN